MKSQKQTTMTSCKMTATEKKAHKEYRKARKVSRGKQWNTL